MKAAIAFTLTFAVVFSAFIIYGKVFDSSQLDPAAIGIGSIICGIIAGAFVHESD